jgi:hypothetical protein
MLASVGVAARDPFPSGGILTRPFVTHIFNLTVVIQVHTVGNTAARKLLHIAWAVVTKAQDFDPHYVQTMQRA